MERVWDHFLQEFCPAEPCFRSIGIFKEENLSTMGGKINKWFIKKYFIKPMLNNGCSVIALNDEDEIVGKFTIMTYEYSSLQPMFQDISWAVLWHSQMTKNRPCQLPPFSSTSPDS